MTEEERDQVADIGIGLLACEMVRARMERDTAAMEDVRAGKLVTRMGRDTHRLEVVTAERLQELLEEAKGHLAANQARLGALLASWGLTEDQAELVPTFWQDLGYPHQLEKVRKALALAEVV